MVHCFFMTRASFLVAAILNEKLTVGCSETLLQNINMQVKLLLKH